MLRPIFTTIVFLCIFKYEVFSQKKFRVDYDLVSSWDSKSKTWSEWKSSDNTFVININNNGDILHIKANNSQVIYKVISGAEKGKVDDKNYQTIDVLDEDGDSFLFQIFDDVHTGLKMIYEGYMIQFSKSN